MLSDSEETIFVAGQSGNGKSSALQLFSSNYSDLNSEYDIKVLNARDIFDKKDIDVADVMLMIAFTIVEENEELKKEFFDILETMRKTKLNELEESHEMSNINAHTHQANVLSGFQFDLGFLKIGADFKNTFKPIVKIKKQLENLLNLKNKILLIKLMKLFVNINALF
jgi:hypothetical protein